MKNKNSYNINPQDITDLSAMAAQLRSADKGVLGSIIKKLRPETQRLLAVYALDTSLSAPLIHALSDDLTGIINGAAIFDSQNINVPNLSAKTRKLLNKQPRGQALALLHRLLLEDLFMESLAQRFHEKRDQKWINLKGGLRRLRGSSVIYGRVKIKGQEYTEMFKTSDPQVARPLFHTWLSELHKSLKSACGRKESLATFVEPYLNSRQEEVARNKLKPGTIPALRQTYRSIAQHWPGFNTLSLARLTAKAMSGISKFLLMHAKNLSQPGKTLSPATYNGYMSALSLLIKYLRREEEISEELFLKLMSKINYAFVPPRKITMPSAEQLKRMRAYLYRVRQGSSHGEAGPKFDTFMLSGQRKATVNAMKVEHINFERGEVWLTKLKGNADEPSEMWRPLVPELLEILQRYIKERGLKDGDYLWKTKNNNTAFRKAAKVAGLENWYHHACRKWFGTMGLKETRDPLAIADLMCHDAKTLLSDYRQICTEFLQATTSVLKLYPGAIAGKSLAAAAARAEKVITRIVASPETVAVKALDCILWIESKLDSRDFAALQHLPRLGQETLPIYSPKPVRRVDGPTPTLLKSNLRYLIEKNGVYHGDIAMATGLRRSVIDHATKSGNLQARYLSALCKYFEVTEDEFLNCDLSAAAPSENSQKVSQPAASSDTGLGAGAPEPAPEPTLGDLISRQDPAALPRVVARNLASIMFERNLTANAVATLADISHSVLLRSLHEEFVPTDASIHKIAKALGIKPIEILDPARDNIVFNRLIVVANIQALIAHSGLASNTFFVRLKLDARCMQKVLQSGEISSAQAHRIVEAHAGAFTLRQLISEDLTPKFPVAPRIDPAVVSRNLASLGWERGLYPAEIARLAGVSLCTGINYVAGRSQRISRELLTKIADCLGLTLAELVDSSRPVVEVTSHFAANLQYLWAQSSLALTPFAERSGLDPRAMEALIGGEPPNPHQVHKIASHLGQKIEDLLGKNLNPDAAPDGSPTHTATTKKNSNPGESNPA